MSEASRDEERQLNPNSALYWLAGTETAAEEYPVKSPETRVVKFDLMDALSFLDGEIPTKFPHGELDTAASDLGWPVFIRTDLTSAKHEGPDGVRARGADEVTDVAATVVHDCAMKSMRPAAFLVREWIDIEHSFTAFDGLPIGPEFRVFATPDEHLCTHYYWPEDSIKHASVPREFWTSKREEAAVTQRPPWLPAAARCAAFEADFENRVEKERAWSVDFARDEDGQWWIIDMALAEDSWHPECEVQL